MHFSWFLRFRLACSLIYFLILLATVFYYQLDLNYWAIFTLIISIPLAACLFKFFLTFRDNIHAYRGALLIADTLILAGIIYLTGGPSNPLSIFFLVQVVLSAVMLSKLWTWGVYLLSSICFLFLFKWHVVIPGGHSHGMHMGMQNGFSAHLFGMFFAYLIVGALVAYFLSNLLVEYNQQKTKLDKLSALTAVSANTAHELGTPMSTIHLIANELLQATDINKDLGEDLLLIKKESSRSKEIISRLRTSISTPESENYEWLSIADFSEAFFSDLKKSQVNINRDLKKFDYFLPIARLKSVIAALIKNAEEACRQNNSNEPLQVDIFEQKKFLVIEITDSGIGVPEIVRKNFAEPFITTKKHGGGMGLGLFVAKLVATNLAGNISYRDAENGGTIMQLMIKVEKRESRI